jgi:hypothetical protein
MNDKQKAKQLGYFNLFGGGDSSGIKSVIFNCIDIRLNLYFFHIW